MANNITGASLHDIYDRLNETSGYHPFEANTFSDWSMEAGDIVTVKRGDESYESPVHTTSLTWKGAPEMAVSSTGNNGRDSISKVSKNKYNSGSAGLRSSNDLRRWFYDAYNGLYSEFEMTASRLGVEFVGLYDGLSSQFELTRSRMYVEFQGMYDGLSSNLELTRSRLSVQFQGMYDGLSSSLEMTRSRLSVEFHGLYDGLNSNFEITRSRLSAEFVGLYDGLSSSFEITRSRLAAQFTGLYDGLSSQFEVTRSRLAAQFTGLYDGLSSQFEVTRSRLAAQFTGLYDGLSSEFEVTRSRLSAQFTGLYDGLSSQFEVTRSRLSAEFQGMYDGLSSSLELTRSRLSVEFQGMYDGLSSSLEVTRSRLSAQFTGLYDGLSSEFEVTRSRLSAQFTGLYDGLSSEFEVTRSRLAAQFTGLYDGLSSQFEVTRSRLSAQFTGLYDGLSSQFEVTRSRMAVEFHGMYDGLSSSLEVTRSRLSAQFSGMYDGLSSSIEVTRSRLSASFQGMYDGLSSEFEMTRSRWTVEFNNAYTGITSLVEQTDSGWRTALSGVVDSNGKVTAASIATKINAQGQAGVAIDGAWVTINGTTKLNDVFTVTDGYVYSKVSLYANPGTVFDGKHVGTYYYNRQEQGHTVSYPMLKKASVDGNTLKIWTMDDGDETPSINFSKATSVSGRWGGGNTGSSTDTYTVTVTQNSETVGTKTVGFASGDDVRMYVGANGTPTASSNRKYVVAPVHAYTVETVGQNPRVVTRGSADVSINATVAYDNGWADYCDAWSYPDEMPASEETRDSIVVVHPGKTSTSADLTKTFKLSVEGGFAYVKSGNVIYAKVSASGSTGSVTFEEGSWSGGTVTITAKSGGDTVGTTTVSLPASTATEWLNTSGDKYKAKITIGDTYRYSEEHDFSAIRTAGYNSAHVTGSWGTSSSNKHIFYYAKTSSSGADNNGSITITAGVEQTYDSGSHTYKATGLAGGTGIASSVHSIQVESGTEAYEAGNSYGYGRAHVTGAWGTSASNKNIFYYAKSSSSDKPNNDTTSVTGTSAISYKSDTHTYVATGSVLNGTNVLYDIPGTESGTEAYVAGDGAGYARARVTGHWGTSASNKNIFYYAKSSDSKNKESDTTTVTGTLAISYSSSTHKYKATGNVLNGETVLYEIPSATGGTEAYGEGYDSAHVTGAWGTSSSNKHIFYYAKTSDTTAKNQGTLTITAGVELDYDSAKHIYKATGLAGGTGIASSVKSAVVESGTQAYVAGDGDGYARAHVTGAWGTSASNKNYFYFNKSSNSKHKDNDFTSVYGTISVEYDSSNHVYKSKGKVFNNKDNLLYETGEHNSGLDAYKDGWKAAGNSVPSFPSTTPSSYDSGIYVYRPNTTVDGAATQYNYVITVDNSYAYINYKTGSTYIAVAKRAHSAYSNCYTSFAYTAPTSKTLAYGEVATVTVTQKNVAGDTITRLERTYTAPADRYNDGWKAAAADDVSDLPSRGSSSKIICSWPANTVGSVREREYTLSVDDDYAYVHRTDLDDGIQVARVTNSAYSHGWAAARAMREVPKAISEHSSDEATIDVSWPGSSKDTQETRTFTLSVESKTVYLRRKDNGYNTGVARISVSGVWNEGDANGYSRAHVTGQWGSTSSNKNVFTFAKSSNSKHKDSGTTTVTGATAISYTSKDHTYTATSNVLNGTNVLFTSTAISGTEAYTAGDSAGYSRAHVTGAWGSTSSDKNIFTFAKSSSSNKPNKDTTKVTGTTSISYSTATHKYTATGLVLNGSNELYRSTAISGTEAYTGGMYDYYWSDSVGGRSGTAKYWLTPTENGGTCTIPNVTNTARATWFTMSKMAITRAQCGLDTDNNKIYHGTLYYKNAKTGKFVAAHAETDPVYWYYSGTNRSGSNTLYY